MEYTVGKRFIPIEILVFPAGSREKGADALC